MNSEESVVRAFLNWLEDENKVDIQIVCEMRVMIPEFIAYQNGDDE